MQTPKPIGPHSRMQDVLETYPGARRALFRRYHIGGCSSCGFDPLETLQEVCQRNDNLEVMQVLEHLEQSHQADEQLLISPAELKQRLAQHPQPRLLDIRSRTEFDAARIAGSQLLSQETMQEMMGQADRNQWIIIVDHEGKQGLDAAAYFAGHGFTNVRCLRGGIDAWSREVDSDVPRYQLA